MKKVKKVRVTPLMKAIQEAESNRQEWIKCDRRADEYMEILQQIKRLFKEKHDHYVGDISVADLPRMVAALVSYKDLNQGTVRGEYHTIELLREIIMWQINPHTASQQKEVDALKKQFTGQR